MTAVKHPTAYGYRQRASVPSITGPDWRLALFIMLALWGTYVFVGSGYDAANSNVIPRMGLIFSIVQAHSLSIGDFAAFSPDKAVVGNQYFLDKAPGASFTALPFVAPIIKSAAMLGFKTAPIVAHDLTRFYLLMVVIANAVTNSLFTAAAASSMFLLLRSWDCSKRASLFAAFTFGLATPAFGWSTVFFGHAMAGACLMLAASLVTWATVQQRPGLWLSFAAGTLTAWSVVVEFTSAPAALAIAVYGVRRGLKLSPENRNRFLMSVVVGGFLAGLPLAIYNQAIFGSPFHLGYEHVVGFEGMQQGFLGISTPKLHVLWEITIGGFRGILWIAPILLLSPLGYIAGFRRLPRDTMVLFLFIPAVYLFINCGYFYWYGGASTGPRHLVPALPFFAIGLGPLWDQARNRAAHWAMLALTVVSSVISLVCASTTMAAANTQDQPLLPYLFDRFFAGQVHNVAIFLPGYITGRHAITGGDAIVSIALLPLLWWALWLGIRGLRHNSPALKPG